MSQNCSPLNNIICHQSLNIFLIKMPNFTKTCTKHTILPGKLVPKLQPPSIIYATKAPPTLTQYYAKSAGPLSEGMRPTDEAGAKTRGWRQERAGPLQTLPEQRMPHHDRNARTCTGRYAHWACAERAARAGGHH